MLFELVSAYGNVGLSMGSAVVPNASFAGTVHNSVKLVLMIVEIFGKTRMLPNTVVFSMKVWTSTPERNSFFASHHAGRQCSQDGSPY